MRAEIFELQRELGTPTIYLTHDPAAAMTMAERVAVICNGRLQQVEEPERLYERPANTLVAAFIGSPTMNMFEARLRRTGDSLLASFGEHRLVIDRELVADRPSLLGGDGATVTLGIRPEDVEDAAFTAVASSGRALDTVLSFREPLGSRVRVHCSLGAPTGQTGSSLVACVDPRTIARVGEPLRLVVNTKRLHFFDPETGVAMFNEQHPHLQALPESPLTGSNR
jgi:multiple sugar transport system ATP-binding protein